MKRFGKKNYQPLVRISLLIIINPLFGFDYPISFYIARSHQAQVQDVDIFTAHWALFTFWQPKKAIFIRLPPATITFFRQKNLMI
jgi:hypothetical protein